MAEILVAIGQMRPGEMSRTIEVFGQPIAFPWIVIDTLGEGGFESIAIMSDTHECDTPWACPAPKDFIKVLVQQKNGEQFLFQGGLEDMARLSTAINRHILDQDGGVIFRANDWVEETRAQAMASPSSQGPSGVNRISIQDFLREVLEQPDHILETTQGGRKILVLTEDEMARRIVEQDRDPRKIGQMVWRANDPTQNITFLGFDMGPADEEDPDA